MKHLFSTILLVAVCSLGMNAETFKPVIFDDPTFDINSDELTAEQRSFFDQYVRAMQRVEAGEDPEKFFVIEQADSDDEGVEPLLGDINFNQGRPYNNNCPVINGGRAVTGCVATSMAMVMRYYKYPACGTGTFKYSGGDEGETTFVLDDHPFDWNNILPAYDDVAYTTAQANAIANLMLACGASLNMNYSKDGSGANTSKVNGLLNRNFGFKDVAFISTENSRNPDEDIELWGEDAVRPDLKAGHPLIFSGYPAVGKTGHCFVIDGYKVEDGKYYYHVNWGWGGAGNSWCLLTRLVDYEGNNYAGHNLQMVFNIVPAKGQGVEDIEADAIHQAAKVLRNGELLIIRDNKTYTLQGQELK